MRKRATTTARIVEVTAADARLRRVDALFVQTASSFSSGDGTMTLRGVAAPTVYFTEQPRREVGHLAVDRFVTLWNEGEDGFAVDPPRAVLSFVDDRRSDTPPLDTVVVLRSARLAGDSLTYEVDVLEGELPAAGGPCSLFIDASGRPLAPVAAAKTARGRRSRPTG